VTGTAALAECGGCAGSQGCSRLDWDLSISVLGTTGYGPYAFHQLFIGCRLSEMASAVAHLQLPNYSPAAPQSPSETSPAASSTNLATAQILLERSEIDKSLKSLENLVSLLYDYTQVWQSLVSLDKKLVSTVGIHDVRFPLTPIFALFRSRH